MEYLPGILAAYAILVVAATSPGPAVALLLGVGAGQGRGAAILTTAGIVAGSMTLNALTFVGVSVLLEQAAWAFTALRLVGAAYLLWLAWGAFKKAVAPTALAAAEVKPRSPARLFAVGYAIQVTNPKAIVFWLAIQAAAGIALAPWAVVVAYFVGAAVISFTCHGAWGLLFASGAFRRGYARARRWVEAALGGFLAYMAFRLATER